MDVSTDRIILSVGNWGGLWLTYSEIHRAIDAV